MRKTDWLAVELPHRPKWSATSRNSRKKRRNITKPTKRLKAANKLPVTFSGLRFTFCFHSFYRLCDFICILEYEILLFRVYFLVSVFGFCFPTAFFIFHGRFRCIKSEKCFANCLRCAIVLANEPVSSNMSWSAEHISARYICKLLSLHFRSLVAGAAFILILMPWKSIVSERSFFSHCLLIDWCIISYA